MICKPTVETLPMPISPKEYDIEKYRELYKKFIQEEEEHSVWSFHNYIYENSETKDLFSMPDQKWIKEHLADEIIQAGGLLEEPKRKCTYVNPRSKYLKETFTQDVIKDLIPRYIRNTHNKNITFGNFCNWVYKTIEDPPSEGWFRTYHKPFIDEELERLKDDDFADEYQIKNAGYDETLEEFVEPMQKIAEYMRTNNMNTPIFTNRLEKRFDLYRSSKNKYAKEIALLLEETYKLKPDRAFYLWAKKLQVEDLEFSWIIAEIFLLRKSNATVREIIEKTKESIVFFTKSMPINLYPDEEVQEDGFEKHIKALLCIASAASKEQVDIDQIYEDLYMTLLNTTKETDAKKYTTLLASHFYAAYDSIISATYEKIMYERCMKERPFSETIEEYRRKCEETKIPPDIMLAEKHGIQPSCRDPWFNSKSFLHNWCWKYGYEYWSKEQKTIIKNIQLTYASKYIELKADDFDNMEIYRFVGKRISLYNDPSAPYKEFTKYCVRLIEEYKKKYILLPEKDESKKLWERNQLDYVVENLKHILSHQHIYPLDSDKFNYIEGLLVNITEKWKWKGEQACAEYLIKHGYVVSEQASFEDCRNIRKLFFDIKAEKNGEMILVEFDGDQHDEFTPHFHEEWEDFEAQRRRDRIKNEYCKKHNIPLYRVHTKDLKDLSKVLPE